MQLFSEIIGNEHVVDSALIGQEAVAVWTNRCIQVILDLAMSEVGASSEDKIVSYWLLVCRGVLIEGCSVQIRVKVWIWLRRRLECLEGWIRRNFNVVALADIRIQVDSDGVGVGRRGFSGQERGLLTIELSNRLGTNSWASGTTQSGVRAS